MPILKLPRKVTGEEVIHAMQAAADSTLGRFHRSGVNGPHVSWNVLGEPGFNSGEDSLELYVRGASLFGRPLNNQRTYKAVAIGGELHNGQWGRGVDLERNDGAKRIYQQFSKELSSALSNGSS